jgi:hypothetical protein
MKRTRNAPPIAKVALKEIHGSRYDKPTDGRRQKVYRWEDHCPLNPGKPVERNVAKGLARLCAKVALRRLAGALKLPPAKVEAIRSDFKARFTKEANRYSFGGLGGVYFAKGGWTPWIIAHEVAHWIDTWELEILKTPRTAHGPHWLGWYVFLLIDVMKVDEAALRADLAANKLQFTMPPKGD